VWCTHRLSGRSRIVLGEEQPYYEYLPEVISNYCRCVQGGCVQASRTGSNGFGCGQEGGFLQ